MTPRCRRAARIIRPLSAVVVLMAVAFGVRWAFLFTIPAFTDEMDDVLYSFPVLLGQPVPRTNFDTFNGGFYTGLIGAALNLSGLDPGAPRFVSWVCGGLTVGATYLLGRVSGGHRVGLVAGALMALTPAHILVNSHVAWSHALTPLFTTMTLALIGAAVAIRSGWFLAFAGVTGGLALQTHASTVALIPGMLLALGRTFRWPGFPGALCLAIGLALLVEAPVIEYTLSSDLQPFQYALDHRRPVDRAAALTVERYGNNLLLELRGLSRAISPWVTDTREPDLAFANSAVVLGAGLGVVGLLGLIVKRQWILVGPLLSFALTLPLLNSQYEPSIMNARYVMPMLPALFVGAGFIAVSCIDRGKGQIRRWLAGGIAIAIIGVSLAGLHRYVTSATDRRLTNTPVIAVTEFLAAEEPYAVVLDEQLNTLLTLGGARVLKNLMVLLNLRGTAYQIVEPAALSELAMPKGARLAVLLHSTAASLQAQFGESFAPPVRYSVLACGGDCSRALRNLFAREPRPHGRRCRWVPVLRAENLDLEPCPNWNDPGVAG